MKKIYYSIAILLLSFAQILNGAEPILYTAQLVIAISFFITASTQYKTS